MDSTEPVPSDMDFDEATRLQLERAENSDDDARLKVLDELYETLEAELVEDSPTRP
jgi:hypothetical protein